LNVYVQGKKIALKASAAIGKGGEADVYDIGGDRVLKLFKTPKHPDYANFPDEQVAAKLRLQTHQTKLPAFPANLPAKVIAPVALATSTKNGQRIVGYTMRRVQPAELLYHYGEAKVRRRGIGAGQRVRVLADLHGSVAALHSCGVVIGDFNDLNVLVSGGEAFLIDADSYQYGGFECAVFSERFVDPVHCDSGANSLGPVLPHSEMSDWYAYTTMLFRSLLFVGPYGGVFRPKDKSRRVAHERRPLKRISVFDREVIYPKPATHFGVLPDELLQHFEDVFVRDRREVFPVELLNELRWTTCGVCGLEHARDLCPTCAGAHKRSQRMTVSVRGDVTVERVFETTGTIVDSSMVDGALRFLYADGQALCREDGLELLHGALEPHQWVRRWRRGVAVGQPGRVCLIEPGQPPEVLATDSCIGQAAFLANTNHHYWLAADLLMRDTELGGESVGGVLSEQTRVWVGERFGFGFYRAGAMSVGFCFDTERGGINDTVPLQLRGKLIDAHCSFGGDYAWLFTRSQRRSRLVSRCHVISRAGELLATAETSTAEGHWLHAGHTSCGAGAFLFVATDTGIVRIERDGARLAVTRRFTETEPFIDAATRLHVSASGIFAVKTNRVLCISLKETS